MKSIILIVVLLFLFPTKSYEQQIIGYESGQIVTKKNDTLNVLVELNPTYGAEVTYKKNEKSRIENIKVNEISSMKTPYNSYASVLVKKHDKIFRYMVYDSISLLQHLQINTGSSQEAHGGTIANYTAPTITYAIRTADTTYIIKKKKDLKRIPFLYGENDQYVDQMNSKKFKLEDLEILIREMNRLIE